MTDGAGGALGALGSLARRSRTVRRALTVPAVAAAAGGLVGSAAVWVPTTLALDLAAGARRLPRLRSVSAAAAWASLETVGVGASAALWAAGRSDDEEAHYRLQHWWASRLRDLLRVCGDVRVEIEGRELVVPGPVVLALRHTTVADALIPVWLLGDQGMRPRYVLKRELLFDPCLDIVGNRVPNHFVERGGDATELELAALRDLAKDMDERDGAVIYPEGTVANDDRRRRAIEHIEARDPDRAARMRELTRLLPPRHAGTKALLDGCPHADLVFVDHLGLEALASLADAPARVPLPDPVKVRVVRVARSRIPDDRAEFKAWFDEQWLALDRGDL